MKPKLVFVSNMAAPYQIKFCYALQRYFDAEFWFHVYLEPERPAWWKIDLGDKCRLLSKVLFKDRRRYFSLDLIPKLHRFNPDIVVLGSFNLPSCMIAYTWAKLRHKKVVLFTEVSRNRRGVVRARGSFTQFVHWWYRDIDLVMTSGVEGTQQFKNVFGFGERVITSQYPSDIDEQLKHPLRDKQPPFIYLYANRLTELYQPLLAIDIFNVIRQRHPDSKLLMNAAGELFDQCQAKIAELGLGEAVTFLDAIPSWNDLHKVYQASDILVLPAKFSAGNFTIIESMASGMGIVVSNKVLGPGIDYIQSGVNGFICEPTIDDFVQAIEKFHADPSLLKSHGTINKPIVRKYSIASTADLWNAQLSQIIES